MTKMIQSKPCIRRATPKDIPSIIDVCQHSIRSTCTKDYSPEQIDAWCRSVSDPSKWKLAINCQYFIVAEEAGKLLGFASIKYGEYLVYLYVHPARQRSGTAQQLLKILLKESQRLGKDYIWSNVSKTAQTFFRKQGFMVEHERINFLEDVEIRNHRMGLNIKEARIIPISNT